MPTDNDPNVQIESGGITFMVATDTVQFYGATAHFQYMKLAYGPTGSASIVSSSNGLPVNVIAGGITANLVGFCGAIQGIPGGQPVEVDGTVYVTGISSAPAYVRTSAGYQVEVTGGRPLSRSTDNISVFGPGGITWVYSNLVNSSGVQFGTTANPIYTSIMGATINATINPIVGVTNDATSALFIRGVTGAVPVPVSLGSTYFSIDDTDILSGMTAIYSKLNDVYSALGAFGVVRPSGITAGIITTVTTAAIQLFSTGYTCTSGVNLKASSSNTDLIYIGTTGISTNLGYILDPGDQFLLNIDNVSKVYVRSKSGTQTLSYLAS
jgi:hypothetical protein